MKSLLCTACSSRDLKEIRPGEYECSYCGARTLVDSADLRGTASSTPRPGGSPVASGGRSASPGGTGPAPSGGTGPTSPGRTGSAAPGNIRGTAVGAGRRRPFLLALVVGIFCLAGALVAILMTQPSETSRSSGRYSSSSLGDEVVAGLDGSTMSDGGHTEGDSGPNNGTPVKSQPQPGQVFGVDAIEKPPVVAAGLGEFVPLPDGIGNTYFVGMVKNTGEAVIDHPRVELSLFDEKGKSLAVSHGYSDQAYLFPGEEIPVKVLVSDTPAYHHFKAAIDPEPATTDPVRLRLTIGNAKLTPDRFQGYRLKGEVTNQGAMIATYVQVVAILFDKKGRTIGMDSSFLGQKKLGPGETAPFEVRLSLVTGTPESFKLYYDHLVERE